MERLCFVFLRKRKSFLISISMCIFRWYSYHFYLVLAIDLIIINLLLLFIIIIVKFIIIKSMVLAGCIHVATSRS